MLDLRDGHEVQAVVVAKMHVSDDGFRFLFRQELARVEESAHRQHGESGIRQGVKARLDLNFLSANEQDWQALGVGTVHAIGYIN